MKRNLILVLLASLCVHLQAQVTSKMPMTNSSNRQKRNMRTFETRQTSNYDIAGMKN